MNDVALLGLGTAVPKLSFSQEEVFSLCGYSSRRFYEIFERSGVKKRHLFFDRKNPQLQETPEQLNERYLRGALQLSQEATAKALSAADISPSQIDCIVTSSCTGYLCPDLASRLVKPLELNSGVQRAGLQGMGCAGAMPALQRASDFVAAHGGVALTIAVEICSAAYFIDEDTETAVGNAICGDGAAAVLLGSPRRGKRAPRILSFHSKILPEHLDKVGFSSNEGKLRIILKESIRTLAPKLAAQTVEEVLNKHGLRREQVRYWMIHPGGSRILELLPDALDIPESALQPSRSILAEFGNVSSPTVLFVFERALKENKPEPGDLGVLLALGPGMAAEAALLSWQE